MPTSPSTWADRVKRLQWYRFTRRLEPERDALERYCRSLTGNRHDAADLAHDTLLLGFAWLGRLWTDVEHPRAFLFRAARNRYVDQQRRSQPLAEAIASTDDPSLALELEQVLNTAKRTLSPSEYDAWLACRIFGSTSQEAADALARTPAAIKMANSRAARKLREALTR